MDNPNPTRILVIDDDEDDFFLTNDYISKIQGAKFQVNWCYKYEEALQKICHEPYDLYLIDYRLGARTGLDLLKDAKKESCDKPMVLLTGKGNQKIDREAMQAGAIDYLVKSDLNTEKLERCIRYALERSLSTQHLRANERKFRGIFEKSKDVVFLAGEDLAFRDINPAATELLGYSRNDLVKMGLNQLLANKTDWDSIGKMLKENGKIDDRELDLVTKLGERISCILSISLETQVSGEKNAHGIIHDITNLKRAERATLQIEKLRLAGRLVSTLAHEVRNPLNNINLSVAQLQAEKATEGSQIFLDIINRNSRRIGDLITELLSSSRPVEMILSRTNLQSVVRETLTMAADRLALKKIDLNVKYPEKPMFIMADSLKLKIGLLNIIINAIEAMKEGVGNLDISFSSVEGFYIVKIGDNGEGISEEDLAKLFEPYFTSKRNGLGLGLASSLNIIEAHKGVIEVKSVVNEGTVFTLSFEKA